MLSYKVYHANFDVWGDVLPGDSHVEFLPAANGLDLALVRCRYYSVTSTLKNELTGLHQDGINAST
jgi:hypothetical protein